MDPATSALQHHFGFRTFLEGQKEIIDSVLQGQNTLGIMPTGHGKSLCFQLPALMLDGVTIVISPLISLMKDQVDALLQRNIPATYINSSLGPHEQQERIRLVRSGHYKLLYIAPERFRARSFVSQISQCKIALVAVDEAHCISQWGHDFRPDYTRLQKALQVFGNIQTIALTATATTEVVEDIVTQLGWHQHNKFITGFDRPNLAFKVHYTENETEKYDILVRLIEKYKKGVVYCSTRKNVEKVTTWLSEAGYRVGAYHAGLSDRERNRIQEQFCAKQNDLIVATNAFGMGIDRGDVRFVIHFNIPGNIESYYQEAGRAGRDGEPANCEILYSHGDIRTQEFFISAQHPTKRLIRATYAWIVEQCSEKDTGTIEGMSLEDMRARLKDDYIDVLSVMTLSSVLTLLRKAGYIESSPDRQRKAWWVSSQAVAPEHLKIDFEGIEQREKLARKKLYQMVDLCRTEACRRYHILAYFDDHHHARGCGICDNCQKHCTGKLRVGNADEQLNLQKLLSCVARLHGRYGREKVQQVLVGSRSKDVFEEGLDALSTYGLMKEFDQAYIYNFLQTCIEGKLVDIAFTAQGHPVVLLTAEGKVVMKKPSTHALRWPIQISPTAKASSVPRRSASETASSLSKEYDRRRAERILNKRANKIRDMDPMLYQRLVQLRSKIAQHFEDMPLYRIFPNKVLESMAQVQPKTLDEMLRIKGVGPSKLRLYGERFLSCIREYRTERSES